MDCMTRLHLVKSHWYQAGMVSNLGRAGQVFADEFLTDEFKSKLLVGVNSLILAGLKEVGGVSASAGVTLGDEAGWRAVRHPTLV